MITKEIIGKNDHLYDALFAEIRERTPLKTIYTLEDYFGKLGDIVEWVSGNMDYAYFLRLPTDEDFFEINANSRVISVPSNYRSHGIAVVGDTYAETLWFKIDKYYDLQDFGDANVQVRIYWELPGAKEKGYSTPIFKDIQSEARYLIFPWVIPNILTQNAGNLQFTISLFKLDNEAVTTIYEFNTLPQTVSIKATLPHATQTDDNTAFGSLKERLTNSSKPGAEYIERPIFVTNSLANEGKTEVTSDFLLSSDSPTRYIEFSAYSHTNGTEMIYTGFKVNGGALAEENKSFIYYTTDDSAPQADKVYYIFSGSDYTPTTGLQEFEGDTTYYEKFVRFNISKAGAYQCKAVAQKQTSGSTSPSEYSSLWIWETPTAINSEEVKLKAVNDDVVIDGDSNPVKFELIKPTEAGQQAAAIWETTLYKVGEIDEIANNLNNDIKSPGEYYAKVRKTLNKVSTEEIETNHLTIQLPATEVTVKLASDQAELVEVGKPVNFVFTNNNIEGHTYQYVIEKYINNKWTDTMVLYTAPVTHTFNEPGKYRIRVKATYGASVKLTQEGNTTPVVIYTIGE